MHRDGLRIALAGRDDVLLEPILQLLVKYITDPLFGDLASSVATIILGTSQCTRIRKLERRLIISIIVIAWWSQLDMYAPVLGQSPLIDALFVRLRKKVEEELRFQVELVKVKGSLDMLFSSSSLS